MVPAGFLAAVLARVATVDIALEDRRVVDVDLTGTHVGHRGAAIVDFVDAYGRIGVVRVFMDLKRQHYAAILVDPPWNFETYSPKGTGRGAVSYNDVMSLDDLKALPVSRYAARDCVLFLWCTNEHVHQYHEVMEAWGFVPKSVAFNWVKCTPHLTENGKNGKAALIGPGNIVMKKGYWTRSGSELCFLGIRGHPARLNADVYQVIVEPPGAHSEKPRRVNDDIMRLVGGPYLELFARRKRQGWTCRGDQVGLFDHGAVNTRRQPSSLARRASPEIDRAR
jgi:N6-adenosine-specific RNA methylase IME4